MDQIKSYIDLSHWTLPIITLFLGITGSTHCVSMCGPISLACSNSRKQNYFYQFGRLFGYLLMGVLFSILGKTIFSGFIDNSIRFYSSVAIGLGLIYMGVKPYFKKRIDLKLPVFWTNYIHRIWGSLIHKEKKSQKVVFLIGFFSILLPCGLLYGLLIPIIAVHSIYIGALSILTFWIGTLPILSMAPYLIQKLLLPLRRKVPVLTSLLLIGLGLVTIFFRAQSANAISTIICN